MNCESKFGKEDTCTDRYSEKKIQTEV